VVPATVRWWPQAEHVRAGRVVQNWQRTLPSGIRAAARRIRPHPLHSVTTCSSLS
jgi:hypothetical protein